MLEFVKSELNSIGIELVAPIPLSACRVLKPHKLKAAGFDDPSKLTAIMMAIPYLAPCDKKNISSYAVARDYHLFASNLLSTLTEALNECFGEYHFCGFADDSPIDERSAAAAAGLGIIGDNMLLITKKHSSYVFLAEIITDFPIPRQENYTVKHCESCGLCRRSCPAEKNGVCLSELTQKKGELTDREKEMISLHGSAWGCDICQEVCPHTLQAAKNGTLYTQIDFFKSDLLPNLSTSLIEGMSDDEFKDRAYSWRKRETILRNLALIEK